MSPIYCTLSAKFLFGLARAPLFIVDQPFPDMLPFVDYHICIYPSPSCLAAFFAFFYKHLFVFLPFQLLSLLSLAFLILTPWSWCYDGSMVVNWVEQSRVSLAQRSLLEKRVILI